MQQPGLFDSSPHHNPRDGDIFFFLFHGLKRVEIIKKKVESGDDGLMHTIFYASPRAQS